MTLFVQLYESNTAAVKSEIGTFFEAFPNGVVWGNTNNGQGYDLVLMGQVEPIKIDLDEMEAKLQSPEYAQVAQSLREIGFNSAIELFCDLRRAADGPRAVAEGRADQPRPQPAAAVPRGHGPEPVSERADLLRDDLAAHAVPGEPVHRIAGDDCRRLRDGIRARAGRQMHR